MRPVCATVIGFGEVGQILADDLRQNGAIVTTWDTAFGDPKSAASQAADRALGAGLRVAGDPASAVAAADLVISAVTAEQTLEAAKAAASALPSAAFFLDLNSCSPSRKRAAAAAVDACGARYVEAAVMSPIEPRRIGSPMLLGGPHVAEFLTLATPLGFTGARPFSEEVGLAAATKLSRSVVIKGLEALLTEALLTARYYGVEDVVLGSLSDLLPLPDWPATADYMMARAKQHGVRRAEEMREAMVAVRDAGLQPLMAEAAAARQAWAASAEARTRPFDAAASRAHGDYR